MLFLNLIFVLRFTIYRGKFRISYLIWHEEIYRFIGGQVHFRHHLGTDGGNLRRIWIQSLPTCRRMWMGRCGCDKSALVLPQDASIENHRLERVDMEIHFRVKWNRSDRDSRITRNFKLYIIKMRGVKIRGLESNGLPFAEEKKSTSNSLSNTSLKIKFQLISSNLFICHQRK